jgi:hypothetical protein
LRHHRQSCHAAVERVRPGGIDNRGTLTVTNTQITDNVIGSTPGSPSPAINARGAA